MKILWHRAADQVIPEAFKGEVGSWGLTRGEIELEVSDVEGAPWCTVRLTVSEAMLIASQGFRAFADFLEGEEGRG